MVAALVVVAAIASPGGSVSAAPGSDPAPGCAFVGCVDITPGDGGIGVGGRKESPGQPDVPGGPGAPGESGGEAEPVGRGPQSPTYIEYVYAPSCEGNTPQATGGLCQGAVVTCPDPAETRYWAWQRTVTRATGAVTAWVRLPGSQCLAVVPDPDNPPVPVRAPIEAVPPLVEEEFQQLPLLAGSAEVQPAGVTLVNFPTNFYTEVARAEQFELTILDYAVVVDARVKGYVWHWGDGTTTKGGPDTRGAPYPELTVTHTYETAQDRAVRVDVVWGGTFSIEGGPTQPIEGTVTVEGDATDLDVVESRSQLVTGG